MCIYNSLIPRPHRRQMLLAVVQKFNPFQICVPGQDLASPQGYSQFLAWGWGSYCMIFLPLHMESSEKKVVSCEINCDLSISESLHVMQNKSWYVTKEVTYGVKINGKRLKKNKRTRLKCVRLSSLFCLYFGSGLGVFFRISCHNVAFFVWICMHGVMQERHAVAYQWRIQDL